ncbi:FNIP protein [Vibrio ichthyoenteri ATCC 700023]|uniref:FNIP protein n=1 Tax=Vibrio ichthyoenteri ATCC 700023 TaxID=870968 RepID=F9S166_9VIBR|nr:leucine-rich repeat domain-containing protein [Vibrio ichthyoenteri]EGU42109.1 FNIP protein [Vibrio ichthyoenteri ATCC 700023]
MEYFARYTEIVIPNQFNDVAVEAIGSDAFRRSKLTKVTLPDSLKLIGHAAFTDNKLLELEIPASVTRIEEYAFWNNEAIKVIAYNRDTQVDYAAFASESSDEEDDYYGYPEDVVYR